MKASELKRQHELNYPLNHFFDKESMEYWGDTMKNYGVRDAGIINTHFGKQECWELYRKKTTSKGCSSSAYFTKDDFRCVLQKK